MPGKLQRINRLSGKGFQAVLVIVIDKGNVIFPCFGDRHRLFARGEQKRIEAIEAIGIVQGYGRVTFEICLDRMNSWPVLIGLDDGFPVIVLVLCRYIIYGKRKFTEIAKLKTKKQFSSRFYFVDFSPLSLQGPAILTPEPVYSVFQ